VTLQSLIETLLSILAVWWTPLFVVLFLAVLAYALWPPHRETFEAAAKMPLRED
jgi:cytochrome c oxidase cbb3-type subunit IV